MEEKDPEARGKRFRDAAREPLPIRRRTAPIARASLIESVRKREAENI